MSCMAGPSPLVHVHKSTAGVLLATSMLVQCSLDWHIHILLAVQCYMYVYVCTYFVNFVYVSFCGIKLLYGKNCI